MKHDLLGSSNAAPRPPHSLPSAIIVLNGFFNESAAREVVASVTDLLGKGAGSVIVEMQRVHADDQLCLKNFVADIMSLRSAGKHVQVAVREPALHAALSAFGDSRDWLLSPPGLEIDGGRRGVYLDTPNVGS